MSPKASIITIIVVGGWVLFFALKYGFIGGSGAGSYRQKNPLNYWLGVATTTIGVLVAIIALILNSVGLMDLK